MKKLFLALVVFLQIAPVFAAPPVMETPVNGYGTPATLLISNATLTMVPSSNTVQTSGRVGIFVSNPSTNSTYPMVGFFGNCTSTSLASTIRPIEITSSSTTITNRYFSMREDVCLWLISMDPLAGMRPIHYQEVKQ